MIPASLSDFVERLATAGFPALMDALLKGTCLVLAAGLVVPLLRRRPAALRHAVWTTTVGLLLALPLLSAALPGWRVLPDWLQFAGDDLAPAEFAASRAPASAFAGRPSRSAAIDVERPPFDAPAELGTVTADAPDVNASASLAQIPPPLPQAAAGEGSATDGTAPRRGATIRRAIIGVWLLGLAAFALRIALSAWTLGRYRRRAIPVADGALTREFGQLRAELAMHSPVQLLLGDDQAMPMAWGVLQPRVLVPRHIEHWPPPQRRAVLLHELGHIARRDPLWQVLVQVAHAVYWFHPLVWLAGWRIHVERERACDDLVLNRGVAARDYARHLLDVVSGGRLRRVGPALGVAMASTGRLEGRVRSILDGRRDRRPLTARVLAASVIACLAVGLPLAMMRGADNGSEGDSDSTSVQPTADRAGESRTPEQLTQRVRELIYVLRQSRVNSRNGEWLGAIRELIEIGRPAVPDLVAELDRTDREQTLRALGFTLRGIGDPRAVPALIRNLPKTSRPGPNSGVAVFVPVREVQEFLKRFEHKFPDERRPPGLERTLVWNTSVNEVLDALHTITGHSIGGDPEQDPLRQRPRETDAADQADRRHPFVDRQRLWDAWWSEHWLEFTSAEDLKSVELSRSPDDPVAEVALARFGPLFPTGPDIVLSEPREAALVGDFGQWDAPAHLDFETGRVFQYLEGAAGLPSDPRDDEPAAWWKWAAANGIDASPLGGVDLHLWLIDEQRWDTIDDEIRRAAPLDLGREVWGNSIPFPQSGEMEQAATLLFTTRSGSRGIVQWFPRDTKTRTTRLRYRLWSTASPEGTDSSSAAPATGPRGGALAPAISLTLQSPGRGRAFVASLSTAQAITPPDDVPLPAEARAFDDPRNAAFAAWCREQGIDVWAQVVSAASLGQDRTPRPALFLGGIDWTARRVQPEAFDSFGVADVRDILGRFAGPADHFSAGPPRSDSAPAPAYVIRTRGGRIGLLRIVEAADDLSSITFQYRLADAQAADGKPDADKAAPPNSSDAPPKDNSADTGNYVFPLDVSGRALDRAGQPIAGAVIFLGSQQAEWKRVSETTTDADGRYHFVQVPLPIKRATSNNEKDLGAFEVFGFADGYAIAWRIRKTFYPDPKDINRNAALDSNDDLTWQFAAGDKIELNLTFDRPVSLSGRIVDDRGRPIPETELDIRYADTEWDQADYSTIRFRGALSSLNERETVPPEFKRRKTDADGRFTYTGLRPDCRYSIWVRPPGFPLKRVWVVTHPGKTQDENGRPIYGDGMELAFTTPVDVPIQVVYADTGEPAPKVMVHLGSVDASSNQSSDAEGRVTLRVPPGAGNFQLNPAHGTPYLVTHGELDVPTTSPERPLLVRLRRAAEVEVTVVDADTGAGMANVDLWRETEHPQPDGRPPLRSRNLHHFRSWEVETRIAHVNRPRTDKDGRLSALFEPGPHRIGVGLDSYPAGYEVIEAAGQVVDCKAGETVKVTFQMRRR